MLQTCYPVEPAKGFALVLGVMGGQNFAQAVKLRCALPHEFAEQRQF